MQSGSFTQEEADENKRISDEVEHTAAKQISIMNSEGRICYYLRDIKLLFLSHFAQLRKMQSHQTGTFNKTVIWLIKMNSNLFSSDSHTATWITRAMNMELNSHSELVLMFASAVKAFDQICPASEIVTLYH